MPGWLCLKRKPPTDEKPENFILLAQKITLGIAEELQSLESRRCIIQRPRKLAAIKQIERQWSSMKKDWLRDKSRRSSVFYNGSPSPALRSMLSGDILSPKLRTMSMAPVEYKDPLTAYLKENPKPASALRTHHSFSSSDSLNFPSSPSSPPSSSSSPLSPLFPLSPRSSHTISALNCCEYLQLEEAFAAYRCDEVLQKMLMVIVVLGVFCLVMQYTPSIMITSLFQVVHPTATATEIKIALGAIAIFLSAISCLGVSYAKKGYPGFFAPLQQFNNSLNLSEERLDTLAFGAGAIKSRCLENHLSPCS